MLVSLLKEIEANTLELTSQSGLAHAGFLDENSLPEGSTRRGSGRVFHGRGKAFSGYEDITVEFLSGVLLVIMFQERTVEWRLSLVSGLSELNCASMIDQVLFQARYEKGAPVFDQHGEPVHIKRVIEESGLKYELNLGDRQNYGFFTDMANGRQWVRGSAKDCRVLNLFSYTCSFSVAAVAAGAEKVVNVDMSSAALSVGKTNHLLNNHRLDHVVFQKLNILKSWSRIGRQGPYDLVIVDPPSFQKGSFLASKDYPKFITRLAGMTNPGARVLFCLNDPLISIDHFRQWLDGGEFEYVNRVENPVAMKEVDSSVGLKVLVYRKLG